MVRMETSKVATKIKDENIALLSTFLLVQSISNGSSSGFIDDSHDIETRNNSSILGGHSKVGFSSFLHLGQNHGADLLWSKSLHLILVLHLQLGSASLTYNFKWPMLHISLNRWLIMLPTNQPLGIKDGVGGVNGHLVLGSISNESLSVSEGHIAWCCPVTLVIGNDLHLAVLEHSDTGVGGAKINSNCCLLTHYL